MFTVVLTEERGCSFITCVPHKWEKNNILMWPKKYKKVDLEEKRRNGMSEPDSNWSEMKCKVKKTGILTFEDAVKYEELFTEFLNTEDEEK